MAQVEASGTAVNDSEKPRPISLKLASNVLFVVSPLMSSSEPLTVAMNDVSVLISDRVTVQDIFEALARRCFLCEGHPGSAWSFNVHQ